MQSQNVNGVWLILYFRITWNNLLLEWLIAILMNCHSDRLPGGRIILVSSSWLSLDLISEATIELAIVVVYYCLLNSFIPLNFTRLLMVNWKEINQPPYKYDQVELEDADWQWGYIVHLGQLNNIDTAENWRSLAYNLTITNHQGTIAALLLVYVAYIIGSNWTAAAPAALVLPPPFVVVVVMIMIIIFVCCVASVTVAASLIIFSSSGHSSHSDRCLSNWSGRKINFSRIIIVACFEVIASTPITITSATHHNIATLRQ